MKGLTRRLATICSVLPLIIGTAGLASDTVGAANPSPSPSLSPVPSYGGNPSCSQKATVAGGKAPVYYCQLFVDAPVYADALLSQPLNIRIRHRDQTARYLSQCKTATEIQLAGGYTPNNWVAQTLVDPSKPASGSNVAYVSEYPFVGLTDWRRGQPGLPPTTSNQVCPGLNQPSPAASPAVTSLKCSGNVDPTDFSINPSDSHSIVANEQNKTALPSVFANRSVTVSVPPQAGASDTTSVTLGFNPNCNKHSVVWGSLTNKTDNGLYGIAQIFYQYGNNAIAFGAQFYQDAERDQDYQAAQFFGFEAPGQGSATTSVNDYEPAAPLPGILKVCALQMPQPYSPDDTGLNGGQGACDSFYVAANGSAPSDSPVLTEYDYSQPDASICPKGSHNMAISAFEAITD